MKKNVEELISTIKGIDFEFLALEFDLKPAQRLRLDFNIYLQIKEEYKKNKIYLFPSSFKVRKTKYGLKKVPLNFSSGKYLFYAPKSIKKAEKLKKCEEVLFQEQFSPKDELFFSLTEEIGSLLGYPKCCINFFKSYNFLQTPEFILKSYENTKNFLSFYLNNLHFNVDSHYCILISHFPCFYECRESIKYAKKYSA